MQLQDGTPFLMESQSMGNFLLIAGTPREGWTNLQFTGLFPVLLHRLVLYLSGQGEDPNRFFTGDTIRFGVLNETLQDQQTVRLPNERLFRPIFNANRSEYDCDATELPGIYTVNSSDRVTGKYALNIRPIESSRFFIQVNQLSSLVKQYPRKVAISTFAESPGKSNLEVNTELTWFFMAAAVILAILETYIGRANRRVKG
jgi:hypothetical protein